MRQQITTLFVIMQEETTLKIYKVSAFDSGQTIGKTDLQLSCLEIQDQFK